MALTHVVDKIVGVDYELLSTMGVNPFKGVFKLPGRSLTIEDIAEKLSKFNTYLDIETARTKVPEILRMKISVPGGTYSFVERGEKYRLEYNQKSH